MSSIIKTPFRLRNAEDFHAQFATGVPTEFLYVAIGKQTAWTDEFFPDIPVDSVQQETDFWDSLIGMKRVIATDIVHVVPRINWTSGAEYFVFDPTLTTAYTTDFYIVNSNHEVYKCLTKTGPGITATAEPTGHNNGVPIDTLDGYTWQYMYELQTYEIENLITDAWLPVTIPASAGGNGHANQDLYGDVLAVRTLGAKYIYVRSLIDESVDIPVDVTYRQVTLISNPHAGDGTAGTDNGLLSASTASATEVQLYSGDILYFENKRPITRTTGQTEEIELVIAF